MVVIRALHQDANNYLPALDCLCPILQSCPKRPNRRGALDPGGSDRSCVDRRSRSERAWVGCALPVAATVRDLLPGLRIDPCDVRLASRRSRVGLAVQSDASHPRTPGDRMAPRDHAFRSVVWCSDTALGPASSRDHSGTHVGRLWGRAEHPLEVPRLGEAACLDKGVTWTRGGSRNRRNRGIRQSSRPTTVICGRGRCASTTTEVADWNRGGLRSTGARKSRAESVVASLGDRGNDVQEDPTDRDHETHDDRDEQPGLR